MVDVDEASAEIRAEVKGRKRKRNDSEQSSDSGWSDVVHSSDDEEEDQEAGALDENGEQIASKKTDYLSIEEKAKKATEVTSSRLLTDADFKRIDAAQLKKQVQGFRKGGKRQKIDRCEVDESAIATCRRDELVDLASIEMIHKKRKHDKDSRLATVMEGREGREKFGSRKSKMNEHASTTNKQKLKNKSFMMLKHKFKGKAKKSFVDKQKDLKKSMLRSKKFK